MDLLLMTMDQRSAYYLQVLEKIGAPLVIAALHGARGEDMADEAQTVAVLLSRAVQTGIDLGKTMQFAALPEQGDALRLALAALSARIMGGQYKAGGKIPAETDIKKIVAAMQAVLAFSENFSPGGNAAQKLAETDAASSAAADGDAGVLMLSAFVPVINAVGAFSFGQPEQTLLTDITSRLRSEATRIAGSLKAPSGDLAVLRTLAQLYASSHETMTARMAQGAPGATLDDVWRLYETRAAMLESLAASIIKGGGQSSASPRAPQTPAQSPPPAKTAPEVPPVFKVPEKAPPVTAATTPPPAKAAGNPMSMFAKKPEAPEAALEGENNLDSGEGGLKNTDLTSTREGAKSQSPMAFFKKPESGAEES